MQNDTPPDELRLRIEPKTKADLDFIVGQIRAQLSPTAYRVAYTIEITLSDPGPHQADLAELQRQITPTGTRTEPIYQRIRGQAQLSAHMLPPTEGHPDQWFYVITAPPSSQGYSHQTFESPGAALDAAEAKIEQHEHMQRWQDASSRVSTTRHALQAAQRLARREKTPEARQAAADAQTAHEQAQAALSAIQAERPASATPPDASRS